MQIQIERASESLHEDHRATARASATLLACPALEKTLHAESVIVLAKGRNTAVSRLRRFARGLTMQDDQSFGVIVIDDASNEGSAGELHQCLEWLGDRLTLVRNAWPRGRMLNNMLAIRELCTDAESLVVIVDLDDALADSSALSRVRQLASEGHDVVLAAPFRPDAPTRVYRPQFEQPRATFGGDVWIHMRGFKKRLFDSVPDEALQFEGRWVEHCEDYAIMLPVVELAERPVYVPEYFYWHERSTVLDEDAPTLTNPATGRARSRGAEGSHRTGTAPSRRPTGPQTPPAV